MIGVINHQLVFEFKDEDRLATALDHYARKNGCSVILIVDRNDVLKAAIVNGEMAFSPNLMEDIQYRIYGHEKCDLYLERNDTIPREVYDCPISNVPFFYKAQPIPEPLIL